MPRTPASRPRPSGFTLIELLVVIGIIALLAGILFPTIAKMRISSQEADTRSLLNQLDQACQAYYLDHRAYPGPFSDAFLVPNAAPPVVQTTLSSGMLSGGTLTNVQPVNPTGQQVTGPENLLLGLMGGLEGVRGGGATAAYFDPAAVGQGPISLNPAKVGRTNAYIDTKSRSNGRLRNAFDQPMGDTVIPEFVDRFTGNGEVQDLDNAATPVLQPFRIGGMPILYLRSHRSGRSSSTGGDSETNPGQSLVTAEPRITAVDYQIQEIMPYTSSSVGTGRPSESELGRKYTSPVVLTSPHGLKSASAGFTITKSPKNAGVSYQYPFDAYDYLVEPTSYDANIEGTLSAPQVAAKKSRKKDSYVLISAGRDRIYGTEDDITNFGSVLP